MFAGLTTNKISFRLNKFFILGLLFCSFIAFNAVGQEERAVHHGDSPADFEEINDLSATDFTHIGNEGVDAKENKITSLDITFIYCKGKLSIMPLKYG